MWQRARTDEQRAERIESILAAAAALFESTSYDDVTLQAIAEQAGFTRSNLYRYFRSREEIFLELYRIDLSAWLGAFESALSALPDPQQGDRSASLRTVDAFADLWTDVLLEQERMLRLSPLLTISLERNSSESLYRDFKQFTSALMERAAAIIMPYVPGLTTDELFQFFLVHQALVSGGAPMGRYSDMQRRVLAAPSLRHLHVDFGELYRHAIGTYLTGLTSGPNTDSPHQ